jgi:hypothetical protein
MVEQFVETQIEQLLGSKGTGLVGVQGIGGEIELRRARIDADYADGRGASGSDER